MPVTTIFIGSSSGAKSQAKALIKEFESSTLKFLPWWEAFPPGTTLLAGLEEIKQRVDGGIFIFSPDSEAEIRRETKMIPNLNVLFEFGYFLGHFEKKKVAMIKYGEFYLPSDFGGYVYIPGSKFFERSKVAAVGKTTKEAFSRWIQDF